jgi:hypothetical protein
METLREKASYSNIVDKEDIKEVYKGFNIVEDNRGFTSHEQVDEFIAKSLASNTKEKKVK